MGIHQPRIVSHRSFKNRRALIRGKILEILISKMEGGYGVNPIQCTEHMEKLKSSRRFIKNNFNLPIMQAKR
jgi:hypothetical protein